jgi:hypothetical protein
MEFEKCSEHHPVSTISNYMFYHFLVINHILHIDLEVFIETFKLKTKNIIPSYQ